MSATPANPLHRSEAGTAATLLEVRSVAKCFGSADVLKNISLQIAGGEFLTLLGESGSGKTTLLRLIAGFEVPTGGENLDERPAPGHAATVPPAGQHRFPALRAIPAPERPRKRGLWTSRKRNAPRTKAAHARKKRCAW